MGEIEELNEINREDEDRESLNHIADGIGEEFKKQFEGVVDINKVIEERDELDRLTGKLNDLLAKYETIIEQFKNLLSMVSEPKPCKGCGKPIYWVVSKHGKSMPITDEGLNHFIDCPEANKFRKKGGKK